MNPDLRLTSGIVLSLHKYVLNSPVSGGPNSARLYGLLLYTTSPHLQCCTFIVLYKYYLKERWVMKIFTQAANILFSLFKTAEALKKSSFKKSFAFALCTITVSSSVRLVFQLYSLGIITAVVKLVFAILGAFLSVFSLPLLFHLFVKFFGGKESFSRTFAPFAFTTTFLPFFALFSVLSSPLVVFLTAVLGIWVSFILGYYLRICTGLSRVRLWIIWIILFFGAGSVFSYYYYTFLEKMLQLI